MKLKKLRWVEGQFGYNYLRVGPFSVGYVGWESGGYKAHVNINNKVWQEHYKSIDEAKEAAESVFELYVAEFHE